MVKIEMNITIQCFNCNKEIDFLDEDFFENEKIPGYICRECAKKVINDKNRKDYTFIM